MFFILFLFSKQSSRAEKGKVHFSNFNLRFIEGHSLDTTVNCTYEL